MYGHSLAATGRILQRLGAGRLVTLADVKDAGAAQARLRD